MQTEKTALYIGRFQPLHNGHLSAIRQIDEAGDVGQFIVGIGSSQYQGYLDHPFSSDLRQQMLRAAINTSKPYNIVNIPDIHDYPRWAGYVAELCPPFDVVYSENDLVKSLFEQKGYEVRPISFESTISATKIRDLMIKGDSWQDLVPPSVRDILESKNVRGAQRLRDIYMRHPKAAVTADIIINYKDEGLVFVERGNEPFKGFLALPGGYWEIGRETIEQTAAREAWEETGLEIDPRSLQILGVYSAPKRDPRGPTISTTFFTKVGSGQLRAGDDAKEIYLLDPSVILPRLAFDHNQMIEDYRARAYTPRSFGGNQHPQQPTYFT